MHIDIEPRDRYFVVRVTGEVGGHTLGEYVSAVMAFGQEFGMNRVLLDERAMGNRVDTYEAYLAGESEEFVKMAQMGYRIACVPDSANRIKNKNFETMMTNRSVNYRVFDTIREAEAWLLK